MIVITILYILLIVSLVFNGLGVIGLHRFPDVYTRLHAATKCTTFGTIFMTFAVMAYSIYMYLQNSGSDQYLNMALHTLAALVAILVTNPTGAHAIARAAHRIGIKPRFASVDHLEKRRGK
ncbi:MAG: monovalent cation/H(+) antiporter subunit G [Thermoplasmata archaeon]